MAIEIISHLSDAQKAELPTVLLEGELSKSLSEAQSFIERELAFGDTYLLAQDTESKQYVGLVSWRFHGMPRHGLVELMHMCVHPDYRGHGIATKLIQEMEKQLPENIRKIFLLTGSNSLPAHKLYEKNGYTLETKLIKHMHDDQDQLVYSKFLK